MRPRVLRELADIVAKPLSIVFESHGSHMKFLVTERRETSFPFPRTV